VPQGGTSGPSTRFTEPVRTRLNQASKTMGFNGRDVRDS
jgi:hypothetical protein